MEDLEYSINILLFNMYEIGTKEVEIGENSDIIVDGVKYDVTAGLWALVMINNPLESSYTSNDLRMYKDLVYRTNVMDHPHNVVIGKSCYKKTKKWIHVFSLETLPLIMLFTTTMMTTTMQHSKIRLNKLAGCRMVWSLIKMVMVMVME